MVGNLHDQLDMVLDDQNGDAVGGKVPDERDELLDLRMREAGRRFVQKQELRRKGQRAGDFKLPLMAECQVGGLLVGKGGKADITQQGHRRLPEMPFVPPERRQPADCRQNVRPVFLVKGHEHVFEHGHVRKQLGVLESARQSEAGQLVAGQAGRFPPQKSDAAGIGPVDPGDRVEKCGFAGAVRPDQRVDFARVDGFVDLVDRDEAAERNRDASGVETCRTVRLFD